jgi:hypothetical protein
MLAGLMAKRIFYEGATLQEFKVELIGLVAMMILAILGLLLRSANNWMSALPSSGSSAGAPPRSHFSSLQTVLQLAVGTLLPVVPLLLTVMPVKQFLDKLPKIAF